MTYAEQIFQSALMFQYLSNLLLVILLIFVASILYKKQKDKVLDYFSALLLSLCIAEVMKYFINMPRPVSEWVIEGSSFPSTHATVAFAAFFFHLLLCHKLTVKQGRLSQPLGKHLSDISKSIYKDKMIILIGLLAVGVGICRVLGQAHYLTDVFAGIILGFVVTVPFVFYDISLRRNV